MHNQIAQAAQVQTEQPKLHNQAVNKLSTNCQEAIKTEKLHTSTQNCQGKKYGSTLQRKTKMQASKLVKATFHHFPGQQSFHKYKSPLSN